MWDIPEDAVIWEDGYAKPAGANAGNFPPLSLKEIAAAAANTGGPIAGHNEFVADGAGVSFATHICDVEVDPETGATKVVRYTVIQDAGKAIHPAYVEGQYQGGAAQGIGWALNEEYIYGKDGRLQNAGFLDYRIPVCSDLPFIDTVILEIPNPNHPYGVRGVGETSIVPPLGGDRQCGVECGRRTHDAYSDVAAAHPEGDRGAWKLTMVNFISGGRSGRLPAERPLLLSKHTISVSSSAS